MSSRDFSFLTLRNTVAYAPDGSYVPPNSYITTSTYGATKWTDTISVSSIYVSSGIIDNLSVSSLFVSTGIANTFSISSLTVSTGIANNFSVSSLTVSTGIANNFSISSLNASTSNISSLTVSTGIANNFSVSSLTVSTGIANNFSISSLTVSTGIANNFSISSLTVSTGIANNFSISSLNASTSNISSLTVSTINGLPFDEGNDVYWASTNVNSIYNRNTGFVGVGTNNPQYILDVSGNINTNGVLTISTTNTPGSALRFITENGFSYIQSGSTLSSINPNILKFTTIDATSTLAVMDFSTLRVGILNDKPDSELDVFGTISLSTNRGAGGALRFTTQAGISFIQAGLNLSTSSANLLKFTNIKAEPGDSALSLDLVNLRAGFGTDKPAVAVQVGNPSSNLSAFNFYTNSVSTTSTIIYGPSIFPQTSTLAGTSLNNNFQSNLLIMGTSTFGQNYGSGIVLGGRSGTWSDEGFPMMPFTRIGGVATNGDASGNIEGDFTVETLRQSGGTAALIERMRIKNTGEVGIGTSTPTAMLDVVGDICTTGLINNQYIGNPVVSTIQFIDLGSGSTSTITIAINSNYPQTFIMSPSVNLSNPLTINFNYTLSTSLQSYEYSIFNVGVNPIQTTWNFISDNNTRSSVTSVSFGNERNTCRLFFNNTLSTLANGHGGPVYSIFQSGTTPFSTISYTRVLPA